MLPDGGGDDEERWLTEGIAGVQPNAFYMHHALWLQVICQRGAGGDRAAGAVRQQMGEDRDLPTKQQCQELLEHPPEATRQAAARASPQPEQQHQDQDQQHQSACILSRVCLCHDGCSLQ